MSSWCSPRAPPNSPSASERQHCRCPQHPPRRKCGIPAAERLPSARAGASVTASAWPHESPAERQPGLKSTRTVPPEVPKSRTLTVRRAGAALSALLYSFPTATNGAAQTVNFRHSAQRAGLLRRYTVCTFERRRQLMTRTPRCTGAFVLSGTCVRFRACGGVAERLNAPALKADVPQGTVGSNPTPSVSPRYPAGRGLCSCPRPAGASAVCAAQTSQRMPSGMLPPTGAGRAMSSDGSVWSPCRYESNQPIMRSV
jgi:hypothetical protein